MTQTKSLAELKADAQKIMGDNVTKHVPLNVNNTNVNSTNKDALIAELKAENAALKRVTSANIVPQFHKDTKRYFCKIPGMRFVFGDGSEHYFMYGRLDIGPDQLGMNNTFIHTNEKHLDNGKPIWQVYQKELDAILGKQTTIFVPEKLALENPYNKDLDPATNALSETELAEKNRAVIAAAGGKVRELESPTGAGTTGMPTDPNSSTVDNRIRTAMMGNITTEGAQDVANSQNAAASNSAG